MQRILLQAAVGFEIRCRTSLVSVVRRVCCAVEPSGLARKSPCLAGSIFRQALQATAGVLNVQPGFLPPGGASPTSYTNVASWARRMQTDAKISFF